MTEPYTPTELDEVEADLNRRVPAVDLQDRNHCRGLLEEVRRLRAGYVRKPSREELANTIADTDALTGIGMRWFPSGELTPQAYAIADAILTLLERTDR